VAVSAGYQVQGSDQSHRVRPEIDARRSPRIDPPGDVLHDDAIGKRGNFAARFDTIQGFPVAEEPLAAPFFACSRNAT